MVTDAEIQVKVWELQAADLGRDAGRAAASWAVSERMDAEGAAKVLWMIRGGDPAAVDYLPREPNLSGEFAGDPTPQSITDEIAGDFSGSDDERAELQDALSSAWEEGVSEVFELECEAELIKLAEPENASDIAAFQHGYMVCALWSSTDGEENPLDDKYSVEDIREHTAVIMRQDCARFVRDHKDTLDRFSELTGRDYGSHGHDLWLTRNGHGAGYWDRYMEADASNREQARNIGEVLSESARQMGEYTLDAMDGGVEAA